MSGCVVLVEPLRIGSNLASWINSAASQPLTLSVGSNANSYLACQTAQGGSFQNYLVPAGKKFIILSIYFTAQASGGTGAGFMAINNENVAGGSGGLRVWEFRAPVDGAATQNKEHQYPIECYIDHFPAGSYVNVTCGTTNYWNYTIYGIETDA